MITNWYDAAESPVPPRISTSRSFLRNSIALSVTPPLGRLAARAPSGDDQVGLRGDGPRGLAAERPHEGLGILARAQLQRAGEDDGLPRERSRGGRLAFGEDRPDAGADELVEERPLLLAREILLDAVGHHGTDALDRLQVFDRGAAQRRDHGAEVGVLWEAIREPRREIVRRRLADVTDAEAVQDPGERT